MNTDRERARRAAQQRVRRMSHRACGNCGEKAEVMLGWGGQTIAICDACMSRLKRDHPLPEEAYNWRTLRGPGLWCSVDEARPCDDCAAAGPDHLSGAPVTGARVGAERERSKPGRGVISRIFGRPSNRS